MIARGKWSETHTERGRRAGSDRRSHPAPLTRARSERERQLHHRTRRAKTSTHARTRATIGDRQGKICHEKETMTANTNNDAIRDAHLYPDEDSSWYRH